KLPVIRLCQWLGVSKAGYYKWLTRKPSKRETDNESLSHYLRRESNSQYCIPGYRKLWEAAVANGFICNKKRVQRLLQNLGYRSCASKKR
ncbi:IS3 family transposase, partial [Vibrio coralliirubri]|uniref:IS3 family transposase n=1 Tax=Vibrio coralliirubri TaxID=1516159 RepID=UPI0012E0A622